MFPSHRKQTGFSMMGTLVVKRLNRYSILSDEDIYFQRNDNDIDFKIQHENNC